jgi:hypothetical protein
MGLVLEAATDVAPAAEEAFLVVDEYGDISAISQHGLRLLGVLEEHVLGRPVEELLVPRLPGVSLDKPLHRAATGTPGPDEVPLRDIRRPSARYLARIGACGPPTAALVVLTPAE